MYKRLWVISIVALVASLETVVVCATASEETVPPAKVPAAVRATIEKHAQEAKVQTVEMVKEHGKTVYDVEIREDGKTTEVKAEKTKAARDESALKQAAKEVQAKVKELLGEGSVIEFALEKDGNYELDYKVKGMTKSARIGPDGKTLELEETIDPSALPKAITEAVQKLYPEGKVKRAESSTTLGRTLYELRVGVGGKSHAITVTPEGKVQEDKTVKARAKKANSAK